MAEYAGPDLRERILALVDRERPLPTQFELVVILREAVARIEVLEQEVERLEGRLEDGWEQIAGDDA